jgi:crotonobetainyl-CoA:carnitine CoA-transferase CaiB-like acyl-CoA transferase
MANNAPLAGLRVVDFTHILAGPFCTQFLADAGANVIKVEPPGGEYARIRGPKRVGPDGTELSSYNASINRGKRSIALDLKNPRGMETANKLVASADVVVENFAPGALAKLGVDFTKYRAANPRLITASISLYGGLEFAGALATRGGLAIVSEGESSVTSMTRDKEDTPLMLGLPLGDMGTGMMSYGAIVTALYEREKTGLGQHLDLSMVRTLLALNGCGIAGAQIVSANRFDLRTAGYGIFPAKDGFVTMGVNNDSLFSRLCGAMGRPELATDPRYEKYQDRDGNADEVDGIIAAWTSTHTADEIVGAVGPSGVPCGKVATTGDVLADPELRALGFFQEIDDGLGGTIDAPRNPMGFFRDHYAIPRLAEHTTELLAEVGIDADEVAKLSADGAFGKAA